jgi:hypothetical protein
MYVCSEASTCSTQYGPRSVDDKIPGLSDIIKKKVAVGCKPTESESQQHTRSTR